MTKNNDNNNKQKVFVTVFTRLGRRAKRGTQPRVMTLVMTPERA